AGAVRGDRAAAVEHRRVLHQVTLLLEGRARIVEARVEHSACRLVLARAVPGDVDAPVLAECDLTAADGAGGDGAARVAVDADGIRELLLAGPPAHIKNVSRAGFSFEVDQVEDP